MRTALREIAGKWAVDLRNQKANSIRRPIGKGCFKEICLKSQHDNAAPERRCRCCPVHNDGEVDEWNHAAAEIEEAEQPRGSSTGRVMRNHRQNLADFGEIKGKASCADGGDKNLHSVTLLHQRARSNRARGGNVRPHLAAMQPHG